jgi:dihydroflavonol-4-reductase
MSKIDKTTPVLVTGATGYIAGWLVKELLDAGYTVHAAVRNPDDKKKTSHLDEIASKSKGTLKYFATDLLKEGSYSEAMEGCELVYHTASPFIINVKNPQKELVDPALKGTRNVLMQANKTPSVKRVVLTSSCAAIYTDNSDLRNTPNGVFTEDIWNTTASLDYQPYSYSKILAEKEAWKIKKEQSRWDLVVINPCVVFGPPLNPDSSLSESIAMLKQLGDGTLKMGTPDIGIGVVDVRDVAKAHLLAGFTPEASGRYITCAHNTSFLQVANELQPRYGDKYPIPRKALPKWLLYAVGPLINKTITWRYIRNNVNRKWKADNSKIRKEFGIKFRPLRETMEESFQVLIDKKII